MIGDVIGRVHIEAQTDDCTCYRDSRCGGILTIREDCPEHFNPIDPRVIVHSHPAQVRRQLVGT